MKTLVNFGGEGGITSARPRGARWSRERGAVDKFRTFWKI